MGHSVGLSFSAVTAPAVGPVTCGPNRRLAHMSLTQLQVQLRHRSSVPFGATAMPCTPLWDFNKQESPSAASRNKYGESGSPCRKPRRCSMGRPGTPLRRQADDEVDSSRATQSLQRAGKPIFSSSSKMYSHDTLSKAFAISNFSSKVGVLR